MNQRRYGFVPYCYNMESCDHPVVLSDSELDTLLLVGFNKLLLGEGWQPPRDLVSESLVADLSLDLSVGLQEIPESVHSSRKLSIT